MEFSTRRPGGLSSSEDRSGWNRFDLPGQQTIYCASSPEGAYGELLGALKISGPYRASDFLDDHGEDDLYALIAQDWAELGARPPGVIDISWLYAHRMYTVTMPPAGELAQAPLASEAPPLGVHYYWQARNRMVLLGSVASPRGERRSQRGSGGGSGPASGQRRLAAVLDTYNLTVGQPAPLPWGQNRPGSSPGPRAPMAISAHLPAIFARALSRRAPVG